MHIRERGAGGTRHVLLALLALLFSLSLGAPRAGAVIVHVGGGKALSVQPLRGAATPQRFDAFFSNLDYSGGPVMHSNANYTFYWEPAGAPAPFPSDYAAGIDRYFADLAHDSGAADNVESVAAQYGDGAGAAAYSSSFAGRLTDTTPYPADGCPTTVNVPVCLTDAQIVAELGRYINLRGLPRDLSHEYFVLLPPAVGTCTDTAASDCSAAFGSASNSKFCAYHSNSDTNPVFLYSLDGYVTNNPGCDDGQHPNASTADGAIAGGLSHEHVETVTDPLPATAWNDYVNGVSTGTEIGDKCDVQVGPALGTANGAAYNQLINGHPYYYQEEWSNQGHTCLQRFTPNATSVTASFTAQTGSGNTVNVDAAASTGATRYSWAYVEDPNNPTFHETTVPTDSFTFSAPGTYTIALTAFAPDGTSAPAARDVIADERPTGDFSVTTPAPRSGQPTSFSAAVNDPDGAISAYSWSFGDGTPASGSGPAPTHTYAAAGTFAVSMTATDSSGLTVTATRAVVVDESPTGDFSVTTAAPTAGQPTSFGASASDPDGAISAYSWSFGDGSPAAAGPAPTHTYAVPGTFTVTMTATDSAGATVSASHAVAVAVAVVVANDAPTAVSVSHGLPVAPSNTFHVVRLALATDGTATISVSLPGPGTIAVAQKRQAKARPAQVRATAASVKAAATVTLRITPTAAARQVLARRRMLTVNVVLTYAPRGGTPSTQTRTLRLHLGGRAARKP